MEVLIPLISGHVSGPEDVSNRGGIGGLNPFDIRACVRTCGVFQQARRGDVLIPLISGHVSGLLAYVRAMACGAS